MNLDSLYNKNFYSLLIIGVVFLIGFVFVTNYSTTDIIEGFSNETNCPNLLIKKDNAFYLYNTKKANVAGVNPVVFRHLEEYKEFIQWTRSRGIRCPVLFLQQTYDTQGQKTYRVLNDPENPNIGLPIQPIFTGEGNDINRRGKITKLYDAGHDKGSYPSYDPMNQYIGLKTPLDEMFHQKGGLSDNPMDTNWGGAEYSQKVIDSGKYKSQEDLKYNPNDYLKN